MCSLRPPLLTLPTRQLLARPLSPPLSCSPHLPPSCATTPLPPINVFYACATPLPRAIEGKMPVARAYSERPEIIPSKQASDNSHTKSSRVKFTLDTCLAGEEEHGERKKIPPSTTTRRKGGHTHISTYSPLANEPDSEAGSAGLGADGYHSRPEAGKADPAAAPDAGRLDRPLWRLCAAASASGCARIHRLLRVGLIEPHVPRFGQLSDSACVLQLVWGRRCIYWHLGWGQVLLRVGHPG